MFCTSCGKEIQENTAFCSGCGMRVGGATSNVNAKSDSRTLHIPEHANGAHSTEWLVLLLLCLILGMLGIHCFYAKRNGRAVVELVCTILGCIVIPSLTLSFVLVIVDLCQIIGCTFKFGDGTQLTK